MFGLFDPIVSDVSGLLSKEDADQLGNALENDSSAVLMLFEHTWATRLADALRNARASCAQRAHPARGDRRAAGGQGDFLKTGARQFAGQFPPINKEVTHDVWTFDRGPPRPRVLRAVARTAVISATATATSHAVRRENAAPAQGRQRRLEAQVEGADGAEPGGPAGPTGASGRRARSGGAAGGGTGLIGQLQQLAQLKEARALSDAEFAAAKAKLLEPSPRSPWSRPDADG